MPQKYTPEFKARALQLIEERVRTEQCSGWIACTAVGEALGGISPHTEAQLVEAGPHRPGPSPRPEHH